MKVANGAHVRSLTFSVSRAENCLGVGLGEEGLDPLLRDEHELSLEAESESESHEFRELLSESLKEKQSEITFLDRLQTF